MTLCALTFSNTSFNEEELTYLLLIHQLPSTSLNEEALTYLLLIHQLPSTSLNEEELTYLLLLHQVPSHYHHHLPDTHRQTCCRCRPDCRQKLYDVAACWD